MHPPRDDFFFGTANPLVGVEADRLEIRAFDQDGNQIGTLTIGGHVRVDALATHPVDDRFTMTLEFQRFHLEP